MSKRYTVAILYCLIGIVSGCAQMKETSLPRALPPPEGKSQIVFVRPDWTTNSAVVFDVTAGKPEFIGFLPGVTRVAYVTEPGEHTFMVTSEAADFMKAELAPNKTYYSIAYSRFGLIQERYSLLPVCKVRSCDFTSPSKEFDVLLKESTLVENTEGSRADAADDMDGFIALQQSYWPKWQRKSPAGKLERTLLSEDGH